MPEIELKQPWTWRTPLVTTHYPAGPAQMSDEAATAAAEAGVVAKPGKAAKETGNGDGLAASAEAGAANNTEG